MEHSGVETDYRPSDSAPQRETQWTSSIRLGTEEPHNVVDVAVLPEQRPTDRTVADADQPYRTFGAPARLKAVPEKHVEAPLRSYENVRDTVIDWVDDKHGQLRAASVRGHIHRYEAGVRQDNFAFSRGANYLALAVSDGVGNAKASHLGSAFASRTVVESESLLRDIVSARHPADVSLRDIATLLRSVATDAGVEGGDVSTTLTAAVILDNQSQAGETSVVLAQIGDSPAYRLSRGEWIELSCPALQSRPGDLIDNSVNPLPGHFMASVWVETFHPGETLVLVSDGVGDPVKSNGEYAAALAALWHRTAPSPADLLKVLDATVKSFDDDRTMIALRFDSPER
ncbi:MAG: protein phosphatase 2C domain-containing protein [Rhodococcus sp.]|nr:protein phosphatase 2C domain-containing protein [Rhodococcus sp. (in: high G+C Gram-positive bacteria)]